ncbi:MAG: HDOD domain-containing protein [bacterium]|nr:HDOD domain-containing protein [bacterium]
MTEDDVIRLIGETENFPMLSPLALEIARMTSDLSAPVQEIAAKIQSDEPLLQKMLKVVNAPFYGLAGNVEKLADAITLLGYKKVCNLAVGISILDMFPAESSGGFDYGRFWERSICSAAAAGEITTRLSSDVPADAFSMGLLQDVGVLFLVRVRPLEYGGAIGIAHSKNLHIARAERDILGMDHAAVGAVLCKHWKMPGLVAEVVRHHHFSEFNESIPDGTRRIIQVVNLSNLFTETLFAADPEVSRKVLNARGQDFFGFGPKMIDSLLEKIPQTANELGEAFSIRVQAGAKAPRIKEKEQFQETCSNCGTKGQKGKFCSECGVSLLVQEKKKSRESNKVLIAEDSIASRRALCFVIKKLGYIPVEAINGAEAVELAKKDPPGMIMLDVMMPRMTGLEALKRIREDSTTAEIPVVMLTSMTDSETVVEAVQSGANDYIVKPYTADVIAQRLKRYMPKAPKR